MGFALVPGLRHIKKEKKRGFWPGVIARVSMYSQLAAIAFKLYILRSTLSLFLRRSAHQELPPFVITNGGPSTITTKKTRPNVSLGRLFFCYILKSLAKPTSSTCGTL